MTDLREVAVNYIVGDEFCTYYAAEQKRINKLMRQAEQFPNDVKIMAINEDGSVVAHLPMKWFKVPSPPKQMSEENRKAASERFKKMHSEKL